MDHRTASTGGISRRQLVRTGAALSAAGLVGSLSPRGVYAAGSDTIKLGLIGCGGRGSGALADCISSNQGVQLHALADLFGDKVEGQAAGYAKKGPAYACPKERCFSGWDAYKKVLDSGVDLVILATPPGFRPLHIRAAAEAGKNIFAEKPVAVDPAGCRMVMDAAKIIDEKKLGFVAGTQRRHTAAYVETLNRIHDGALGDLVAGQCYWNQGGLWVRQKAAGMSDTEWQVRNWLYFTWLSGDHIVEQHVHQIDVMNWAMGGPPVSAYGMGGRQARTSPNCGHIWDHFAIEYVYKNGARVMSMCRQIDQTEGRVAQNVQGTKGSSNCEGVILGANAWKHEGGGGRRSLGGTQLEHVDLIESIRSGKPLNEAQRIAETTLTAVMGRMSAYCGRTVTWDQAIKSKLDLMPKTLEFGPMPTPPVASGHDPLV